MKSLGAWRWEDMCGPDGLSLWSKRTKDLGICFQELCLQTPVFVLLATISAYYYGKQSNWFVRPRRHLKILWLRAFATALMALATATRICYMIVSSPGKLQPVDYLVATVEGVTWLVHLGYILALRHRVGVSLRGPISLRVVWTLSFVLSAVSMRSHVLLRDNIPDPSLSYIINLSYGFSITGLVLQLVYLFTLIPSERSWNAGYEELEQHMHNSESQSLLGSPRLGTYSRFSEERDPHYLGVAMENVPFCSKLLFHWVTPLMEKGAKKKLTNSDDLYDLPLNLTPAYLCAQLEMAMIESSNKNNPFESDRRITSNGTTQNGQEIPDVTFRGTETRRSVSLLKALHVCFGVQFYCIGFLKLIADCAGFMGPLLLNRLVTFIETNIGEIVNFMSTDTDRIVNSCPSFHAFWSIPFQIAVSFYLLYTQVGIAFIAGVIFTVILIPINKYIATKIGELSTKLMLKKDERVKVMAEILRGIRVVKLHVWEDHFVGKIGKLRDMELKYLSGRKYLDALCVYFWATTPVLISIFTFVTYVFTSIALLNMLISPLNAFPWVLNGLTEAWVSYYTPLPDDNNELSIFVKNGNFCWDPSAVNNNDTKQPDEENHEEQTSVKFCLNNITFTATQGQYIGVMGSVGSGKSSLLAALLAEIDKESGVVALSDTDRGYGFVTQQPWLQRGTIRDNILFGKSFEHNRYNIHLQHFSYSLLEKDKNIYFMDDIMSAVDVNVARLIFHKCINGLLRNKTRILCTHHVQYLFSADKILPAEILNDFDDYLSPSEFEFGESSSSHNETLKKAKMKNNDEGDTLSLDSIMEEEEREVGTVHLNVYLSYIKAVGLLLSIAILLSMILMQSSRNLTDWWLSYWTNISDQLNYFGNGTDDGDNVKYYLTVYGIFAGLNTVFTLFRAFLFAYGGILAAKNAKVTFFDVSPLGRILNRFSSDTYTIDDSLPFITNILLAQAFGLLEANQKCQYASQAAGQWLSLRLQFIGVAMVSGIGIIAVLQHQFNVADPGLIGLAISYALAVTGLLSGVVNAFTETEKEMIAVERACQYINQVEPEKSREILAPPYAWPSQGVITFNNVSLKYREHLSPSLKGISFTTRPAEKIGVVGRTGAGKSSLFTALFRLAELNDGEILIDTVNIAHIGLVGLRSRLSIIPQEPFLFCGTVRENIDPLDEYRDTELVGALQRCHLATAVNRLGGLAAQVGHGGYNLSVGQRQLLCLVRAVLHNAKILCIDEATANVDAETDRHIQRTLRTSFQKSTVITIAHRCKFNTVVATDATIAAFAALRKENEGETLAGNCF
ncbi:hypothetical protein C0J52_05033 [Blattella germanica]|nr:hypothetical protein C0J52_05033 [Blattella germanica]